MMCWFAFDMVDTNIQKELKTSIRGNIRHKFTFCFSNPNSNFKRAKIDNKDI
jgi:hypothetical protein